MCEPFCLSSRVPTRATFSLEKFAKRGGAGGPIDGWGIAFHEGLDARLYKEPEPAADSAWLRFIRHRQLSSRLVLSHIRRATRGPVTLANTQPFIREFGGHVHVFAHNGRSQRHRRSVPSAAPVQPAGADGFGDSLLHSPAAAGPGLVRRQCPIGRGAPVDHDAFCRRHARPRPSQFPLHGRRGAVRTRPPADTAGWHRRATRPVASLPRMRRSIPTPWRKPAS